MKPRHLFNFAAMSGLTFAWSAPSVLAAPFLGRRMSKIARAWASQVTKVCGVEVEFVSPPVPLDASAYLIMANHSSNFDIPALFSAMPLDMFPVAKRELQFVPIFGWALKAGAAIMIDRRDRERARASLEKAGVAIREGRSVLMFPEGTRTHGESVGELKKGPFHLAMAARVPILPVSIAGTEAVLASGDWKITPGHARVVVGEPIPTEHLADTPEGRAALAQQVRQALNGLLTTADQA